MARDGVSRAPFIVALTYALSWTGACSDDFDSVSEIKTLRIIAVQADSPYASAGAEVTFTLTAQDGGVDEPREIEVAWLGGCANPPGGSFASCLPRIGAALGQPGDGGVVREVLVPASDGSFTSSAFTATVPADILQGGNDSGEARSGTFLVFFAICAGHVEASEASDELGDFPVGCFTADGQQLGAEHFVPGYTQILVFEDGRSNANPPIHGITMDGNELTGEGSDNVVAACTEASADPGCGQGSDGAETRCETYDIKALVDDVAEEDPAALDADGVPQREIVWVDYYVDGGSLRSGRKLVSDATAGYQPGFHTAWSPPAHGGPVRIWAVVHDSRGGVDVATGVVSVE